MEKAKDAPHLSFLMKVLYSVNCTDGPVSLSETKHYRGCSCLQVCTSVKCRKAPAVCYEFVRTANLCDYKIIVVLLNKSHICTVYMHTI